MALKLVIGNKNYSSWSMRPWVLLREAGIAFEEVQLKFDDAGHIAEARQYSPAGQVPVLLVGSGPVWDSLAICETAAEMFPDKQLWPAETRARQLARSICAEMHAGFRNLRRAMPMNIRSSFPGKGMSPEVQHDIDHIVAIWHSCRERHAGQGDMLFGRFSVADAYYAPVVMRFMTHAVALPPQAQAYADAVCALSSVREWMAAALLETEFVAADEPYAQVRSEG
ncbi:MAG: glutathione S-transferase family protein [Burkholderiales bacterium]|nr:glutathione S-transferase family protein [Burkholderiales bacterium]